MLRTKIQLKTKVSITNSVIFLFKLELKQFNISKILPMWKIGVYIVLRVNVVYKVNYNTISYFFLELECYFLVGSLLRISMLI